MFCILMVRISFINSILINESDGCQKFEWAPGKSLLAVANKNELLVYEVTGLKLEIIYEDHIFIGNVVRYSNTNSFLILGQHITDIVWNSEGTMLAIITNQGMVRFYEYDGKSAINPNYKLGDEATKFVRGLFTDFTQLKLDLFDL